MTEIAMTKRKAKFPGEVGLFVEGFIAAEDFGLVPVGKELLVKARSPRSMKQHRFAWALATKVAEACDWLHDKDDAMDAILIAARHAKIITNPITGVMTVLPKSISFSALDQVAFQRIMNRMIYVICRDIVPGLEESSLRDEIMAMVAPTESAATDGGADKKTIPDDHPTPTGAGPEPGQAGGSPATDSAQPAGDHEQAAGTADGALATEPPDGADPQSAHQASPGPSPGEAEAGPSSDTPEGPASLYLAYAEKLGAATSANDIRRATNDFWTTRIKPETHSEDAAMFRRIKNVHLERIEGRLTPAQAQETVKELVAG